jgi:hypothetical protein
MTESELKRLLVTLHSRKSNGKPSHEIIIGFKCPVENLNDIDRFVNATQTRLSGINAGTLDIFGIDLDGSSGEFLISCNEGINIESVYHEIRPTMADYNFFDYSFVVMKTLKSEGEYETKFEYIRESRIPEDNDPELPIPEGVNLAKSGGCLGYLTLLISLGITLLAFCY